jgi:hypothetical protein
MGVDNNYKRQMHGGGKRLETSNSHHRHNEKNENTSVHIETFAGALIARLQYLPLLWECYPAVHNVGAGNTTARCSPVATGPQPLVWVELLYQTFQITGFIA